MIVSLFFYYLSASTFDIVKYFPCSPDGNLAEMLKDEEGFEAPLPDDQSLYYLQQILEGVNFLHQSGFVHLDIKGIYLLTFVLMHK